MKAWFRYHPSLSLKSRETSILENFRSLVEKKTVESFEKLTSVYTFAGKYKEGDPARTYLQKVYGGQSFEIIDLVAHGKDAAVTIKLNQKPLGLLLELAHASGSTIETIREFRLNATH